MAVAVAWAFVIPAAPLAAGEPDRPSAARLAAAIPYAIGAVICHQRPERSFFLWSRQLPVCARCAGLYAGAALIAIGSFAVRRAEAVRHTRNVAQGLSPAITLWLAALPTAATLAYEWTTGVMPSNALRALAGLPLGAAVAWAILSVLDDQVN